MLFNSLPKNERNAIAYSNMIRGATRACSLIFLSIILKLFSIVQL